MSVGSGRLRLRSRAWRHTSSATGRSESDDVAVEDLRSTVAGLEDGEWVWVDAVDPDHGDVAEIQRQLDLHDLAVEDVRQRNQRPKLDLYPGHAFAVFRPLAVGPDGLAGSELFVFASPRFLVTLRFAPAFDLAKAKQRWPIVCALAPGPCLGALCDRRRDRGRLPRGGRGAGGSRGRARETRSSDRTRRRGRGRPCAPARDPPSPSTTPCSSGATRSRCAS